ncbi:hypothetical protein TRIATDRAFT_317874 [Trichoderma atroviride IMI 206040]|uniref:Uncharacterized protein n=1 Tax=Hypocrea atroviridis (strain ATCC 20476 / IMI 206040) TaxID=452589 RepID=G9NUK6_HYPAI|nr:uncharacterized protein TRIATDRAFT_317874 [Trichoderma atroviride IMI 206040]EHK45733.1 hypothetical protein TRIATDRAFT_317874 [Trichoderma atroviride IMI 206040]
MGSAICPQELSSMTRSMTRTTFDRLGNDKLPFLDYAIRNVLFHANAAQKYGISQAGFLKEFEARSWIIIRSSYKDRSDYSDPRLLYTLAKENMSSLIGCHPFKLAFSEVGDERFGTPLCAALARRNNETILEFLKAQAESTPEFHDLYEEYCPKRFGLNAFDNHDFDRKRNMLSYCSHVGEGREILQVAMLLNTRHPYLNVNWEDECSQSPLLYVYSKGNKALLGVLIEKCISDVYEIPRFSYALLRAAVKQEHGDFVEFLLQKGAKINARNYWGETVLCCAVQGNLKDMVQLLIKAGSDTEACGWRDDMTPLLEAATSGYKHLIDMLLEKGADIEAMNKLGRTPLICAMRYDHVDVALQLIEKGSNIEAMDKEGQTPLMWAIRRRNLGLVKLLLSQGAKVTTGEVANIRPRGSEFSEVSREEVMANREPTLLGFARQFEETEEITEMLFRNGAT